MSQSDQNRTHGVKEMVMDLRDWIVDHSKIVMPCVLVVCVILTIVVAVNANRKESLEKEAQQAAMVVAEEETESAADEKIAVPIYELEEDAYPEVNNIIRTYYDAQAAGDIETVSSLNTYLNELQTIRVQELSKYIDSYPVIKVYTKPGMTENTYVAYVYTEVQFIDADKALPGMQTYYIGQDSGGEYFLNDGTYDDAIWDYIKQLTLQDDVVDLNNKVAVQYNELLAEDEELNEYLAYVKEKIDEEVGEILAQAEIAEEEEPEVSESEGNDGESTPETEDAQQEQVSTIVRATDVVNIRNSDSEEADKVGKAQIGEEFTLLEKKGNGWSKILYNGNNAYIKSDYLEAVPEKTADTLVAEGGQSEPEPTPAPVSEGSDVIGKVTVKESVRVRKSASTDAEALGTAYEGDELDLIMKQADGWTKVKFNGQTAFVKSDFVE